MLGMRDGMGGTLQVLAWDYHVQFGAKFRRTAFL